MVHCLLDYVHTLEDFGWHQLTIMFLEMNENVSHGVVDGFCRAITYIFNVNLLNCGDDFLHKEFLEPNHFAKNTHFLGVIDLHV